MENRAFHLLGVRKENLPPPLSEYRFSLPWSIISSPPLTSVSELRHQAGLLKHEVRLGNGDVLELSRDDLVKTEVESRAGLLNSSVRSEILGIHRAASPQAGKYKAKSANARGLASQGPQHPFPNVCSLQSYLQSHLQSQEMLLHLWCGDSKPTLLVCPVSASMPPAEVLPFFSNVKTR